MAASVNMVILVGTLGKDPEIFSELRMFVTANLRVATARRADRRRSGSVSGGDVIGWAAAEAASNLTSFDCGSTLMGQF